MEGHILSDIDGRLRLRLDRNSGLSEADVLRLSAALLAGGAPGLCRYNPRTRGLLIVYKAERAAVLALAAGFSPAGKAPSPAEGAPGEGGPAAPWRSLGRRFLIKKALPLPLRSLWSLISALPYFLKGLNSFLSIRLNVELLDAAALALCFLRRDFKAAGTLLFFFSLNGGLENWTRRKSRASLFRSLTGRPEKVWLRTAEGEEKLVEEDELRPGCLVIVRAGGLIPVDGLAVEGEALVNQSAMTGESLPAAKRPGGAVFAGTSVVEGQLLIKVQQAGRGTRLRALAGFIEKAEAAKAGLQGRAERLADSLAPFSFIMGALVFALTRDLNRTANVFLVDYSCAIRLATPLAVLTALREGHERGLLIKGGRYLEEMAAADTVVFDKTGTLTEARPRVEEVLPCGGFAREEILRLAACLEEHFPHPVGRAVVRQARLEGLKHEEEHARVEYVAAHGIASTWRGRRALLGSRHFVLDDNRTSLDGPAEELMNRAAAKGGGLLFMAIDGRLAGLITIQDRLRPGVRELLPRLKEAGLRRLIMLTGDTEAAAAEVARAAGLEEYRARLLPDEKAALVAELTRSGRRVIMVGDGLNDSAALAGADVGLALGDGAALARDVADIIIQTGDLEALLTARRLSELALARIKRNYRFIVAANTLFLVSGLTGLTGTRLTAGLHNAATSLTAWLATAPLLPPPASPAG